jgi:membrane protein DedA with SNARE-associated domain
VFFGRFVAALLFNALGGITWATVFGVLAYLFGTSISGIADELGIVFPILAVTAALIGFVLVKRYEQLLEAERALPGPLYGPHPTRNRRNA